MRNNILRTNNIVWGYIDYNTGNIVLYSPTLCNKIEKMYQINKNYLNIEYLNTVIYYKTFKQKINNKIIDIFRETLNDNILYKSVYLNENTKNYELYQKKKHVGIIIDTSVNNIKTYEKIVTNIILNYKNENEIIHFYGINNDNIVYKSDIHNIINLKKLFNNNYLKFDIYKNLSIIAESISSNYYEKEEVILYIVSDKSKLDCISNEKYKNWSLFKINTENININKYK